MTERERQMALIELKREKRRAEKEGSFEEIAELIGLAERQQAELNERYKNKSVFLQLKCVLILCFYSLHNVMKQEVSDPCKNRISVSDIVCQRQVSLCRNDVYTVAISVIQSVLKIIISFGYSI